MSKPKIGLLHVIQAYKAGTLKADQIRPGIRAKVVRMAGEHTGVALAGYNRPAATPVTNVRESRPHIRARAD